MSDWIVTDPLIDFLLKLTHYGLENTSTRRFYSKYPAIVEDINDPSKEGRVKVLVEIIGHDEALSLWAYPSSPYAGPDRGFYSPPHKGDNVWVWFDHGDPTQPHFSGGWWCNPARDTDNEAKPGTSHVPDEFKNDGAPNVRGMKTDKILWLMDDDAEADPRFEVATIDPQGVGKSAKKRNRFVMSDQAGNERIRLVTRLLHEILMSDKPSQQLVRITTKLGHVALLDDNKQKITVATPNSGPSLEMDLAQLSSVLKTPNQSVELLDLQQRMDLKSTGTISLSGNLNLEHTFQGQANLVYNLLNLQATAASTMAFMGGVTLSASAGAILLTGLTVQILSLAAGGVILGAVGTALRLVTETIVALLNTLILSHNTLSASHDAHVHPFIGNLGAPGVTAPNGSASPPVPVIDPNAVTTTTTVAS